MYYRVLDLRSLQHFLFARLVNAQLLTKAKLVAVESSTLNIKAAGESIETCGVVLLQKHLTCKVLTKSDSE